MSTRLVDRPIPSARPVATLLLAALASFGAPVQAAGDEAPGEAFDFGVLPHPLVCAVQSRCLESGQCLDLSVEAMRSRLVYDDGIWLWDVVEDWDGFAVLVAPNAEAAHDIHLDDPQFGLALVASGTRDGPEIQIDVHRLVQRFANDRSAAMLPGHIRYSCTPEGRDLAPMTARDAAAEPTSDPAAETTSEPAE